MAKVIEQTGETSASIAYVDDGYGRPFQEKLQAALRRRGITVSDAVGYAVDDDAFTTEAARLVTPHGGAIALIGDEDAGSRMLGALAQAIGDGPRDVVVNDSLRQPWSLSLLASVKDGERSHIVGVSQSVLTQDPDLLRLVTAEDPAATGLFAAQAYDCANLFMLAAQQANSTQPAVLASVIPDVSTGGSRCLTFVQCKELLEDNRNINYEGPDGALAIGSNGDPESGVFDQFAFDSGGRDVTTNTISVSYAGS
jgi:branched-chain amino acid transport system substrate-binding protein